MLEFLKEKTDGKTETFALSDGGKIVARAVISGTSLEKVEYETAEADKRYGDFLLRSAAFALKNRGRDISAKFVDERLSSLGFTATENGGMKADAWTLDFNACGGCKR